MHQRHGGLAAQRVSPKFVPLFSTFSHFTVMADLEEILRTCKSLMAHNDCPDGHPVEAQRDSLSNTLARDQAVVEETKL